MISIILPISRTDFLKPVFDCLNALERPADTELLIITDGDESLGRAVDRRLDSISFKRIQVVNFGDKPGEDINSRRYRISAIHNKAAYYIPNDCEYVFSIEDDTTYPPDTLTRMLKTFEGYSNCAFVEGIELGRRKTPYIGGWKADDVNNPSEILSVMPSHGLQNIDAGGLYCALIDADLYKMHTFEPFDKQGTNGLSCDLNFGLYLRQQNYDCFIDWSIQCDHIGETGSVNLGNTRPVQVIFEKATNRWSARTKV
jgi:hypothetical protein